MRCGNQNCDYNKAKICQRASIELDAQGRCMDFCCCGVSRRDDFHQLPFETPQEEEE